jgi:hypothetical protein
VRRVPDIRDDIINAARPPGAVVQFDSFRRKRETTKFAGLLLIAYFAFMMLARPLHASPAAKAKGEHALSSRGNSRMGCRYFVMFRPPSLLAPQIVLPLRILPQGSRGVYVRAERGSLPPRASDMLTARRQAIGGTGTCTPLDCGLVGCSFPAVQHSVSIRVWNKVGARYSTA